MIENVIVGCGIGIACAAAVSWWLLLVRLLPLLYWMRLEAETRRDAWREIGRLAARTNPEKRS